jgi:hypothetical protein
LLEARPNVVASDDEMPCTGSVALWNGGLSGSERHRVVPRPRRHLVTYHGAFAPAAGQ